MWKISVLGCFLLIVTVVTNASGLELPAGIEKCNYGDAQCLIEQANKVFEKYPHGNAELFVPDLNPLKLDSLAFSQDSSTSVNLNMKMTDIKVADFHTARFFNATPAQASDWNNTVLTLWATAPTMNIKSKYTINGKVLVLPIEGSGDMHMTVTNPRHVIKIKVGTHKEEGKTYLTVDKLRIRSEAENIKFRMDNLFNGDKVLGDNLNKVINENWKVIWNEVEPAVDRAFVETMKKGMDSFFKINPIEDIFILQK